jgi:hypothetical protein
VTFTEALNPKFSIVSPEFPVKDEADSRHFHRAAACLEPGLKAMFEAITSLDTGFRRYDKCRLSLIELHK